MASQTSTARFDNNFDKSFKGFYSWLISSVCIVRLLVGCAFNIKALRYFFVALIATSFCTTLSFADTENISNKAVFIGNESNEDLTGSGLDTSEKIIKKSTTRTSSSPFPNSGICFYSYRSKSSNKCTEASVRVSPFIKIAAGPAVYFSSIAIGAKTDGTGGTHVAPTVDIQLSAGLDFRFRNPRNGDSMLFAIEAGFDWFPFGPVAGGNSFAAIYSGQVKITLGGDINRAWKLKTKKHRTLYGAALLNFGALAVSGTGAADNGLWMAYNASGPFFSWAILAGPGMLFEVAHGMYIGVDILGGIANFPQTNHKGGGGDLYFGMIMPSLAFKFVF